MSRVIHAECDIRPSSTLRGYEFSGNRFQIVCDEYPDGPGRVIRATAVLSPKDARELAQAILRHVGE